MAKTKPAVKSAKKKASVDFITDIVSEYFTDENGRKIDAIRTEIQKWKDRNLIAEDEFYILLTSLIETIPYFANISLILTSSIIF